MASLKSETKIAAQEPKEKIALVTGGNRGIGQPIVRGLAKIPGTTVIFTSRKEDEGKKALEDFQKEGFKNVVFHQLDGEDDASINRLIQDIVKQYKRVDWLVNNAAIFPEYNVSFAKTDIEKVKQGFNVNTLCPLKLCMAFVPKMKENGYGRVINMSSGAGQLSDMNGQHVAYRLSKVSLNALTKIINDELKDVPNVLVNSMCPGFVKTDMTGGANSRATRTPEQGAATAIWLATLGADGPRGGFFRDEESIPW